MNILHNDALAQSLSDESVAFTGYSFPPVLPYRRLVKVAFFLSLLGWGGLMVHAEASVIFYFCVLAKIDRQLSFHKA